MVDIDSFGRLALPREGNTYDWKTVDLSLRPGTAAVDAGEVLANVRRPYKEKRPDMGCYEHGNAPPRYGPRP